MAISSGSDSSPHFHTVTAFRENQIILLARSVEFGGENLSESPDIIIINLSFLLTKHEKGLICFVFN